MDQRQTFENPEVLKALLQDLHLARAPVSLLLDRDGLTRREGLITAVDDHSKPVTAATFTMNNRVGDPISLQEVIAVNGIFRSDYTEC